MEERIAMEQYEVFAKTTLRSSRGNLEDYIVHLSLDEEGKVISADETKGKISPRLYVLLALMLKTYQKLKIPFAGKVRYYHSAIRHCQPWADHHPALEMTESCRTYQLDKCVSADWLVNVPVEDLLSMANYIVNLPQEDPLMYHTVYTDGKMPYTILRDTIREVRKWKLSIQRCLRS